MLQSSPIVRNGVTIGLRGLLVDITKQKKAEADLWESEKRYRSLVEESFDGVLIHDGSIIRFANRRLHELLGYDSEDIIGKDYTISAIRIHTR